MKKTKSISKKTKSEIRTFSLRLLYSPLIHGRKDWPHEIPKDMELPIYFIEREIRLEVFFRTFERLGLTRGGVVGISYFDIILGLVRHTLKSDSEETFQRYEKLILFHTEDFPVDDLVILRRAIRIYRELIKPKRKKTKKEKKFLPAVDTVRLLPLKNEPPKGFS